MLRSAQSYFYVVLAIAISIEFRNFWDFVYCFAANKKAFCHMVAN